MVNEAKVFPTKTTPMNIRTHSALVRAFASICAVLLLASPARAGFHQWQIRELFTNLDGTQQFIELFTSVDNQQFTNGTQIQVTEQATSITHTFTFPSNTSSPTSNHAILIATAGLAAAGGPASNFTIPSSFLFAGASTITYVSTVQGAVSYASLPTDGNLSLAVPANTTQANSPQNYAGTVGHVPEPTTWGLIGLGGFGLCLLFRRRATA